MDPQHFIQTVDQNREIFERPLISGGCHCPLYVAVVALCDEDIQDSLLSTLFREEVNPDPLRAAENLGLDPSFALGISDGWDGYTYDDQEAPKDQRLHLAGKLVGAVYRSLYRWDMAVVSHFKHVRVRGLLQA